YTGVTFIGSTDGLPWLYTDATTGNFNASSWPSGVSWSSGEYWINDYVAAWTSDAGASGKIVFDAQDATFVSLNYSSYGNLYLEAYDASNNLLDSTSGPANLRYINGNGGGPGTLTVTGTDIAYVMVHDTGNYWLIDNVVTDATGITGGVPVVPEPLTCAALGLGLVTLSGYIRRRRK
ncbi:MAG: PEP-CTERM sorting domain-containing protein, partial [Planctomycetes bacterium]|nr:PEP-CTERM sorting domain-containing protein [Planctomycetota bacterium]